MKTINMTGQSYETPEIKQFNLQKEGVLCMSGNNEAYAGEEGDNYLEIF